MWASSPVLYCLPFTAFRYIITTVIRSFRCPDTERLFRRESVKRFKAIERQALRKLDMLDAAPDLRTLATLPGNRLEPLKGDRKGQYSIRINDQWRICFVWSDGHAHEVEIVDYH
jgi:toxin HigB-1